ncbi:MAG: hypothetical protein Q8S54_18855 [Bacteroidota bacterium]|nr:hypothetical protein [Bacteroidota bacterium]
MKNLFALFLVNLFLIGNLSAQNIEKWIDSKKPLLFEKLYLHVDREFYSPGDKIWIKVYQVNGITHKLNSNFRNVFVQLVSETGKVITEHVLFSVNGQAHGEIVTENLESGMYTIRAYTSYLKNFGEEACFHKRIWISRTMNPANLFDNNQADYSKIDVSFFPESGNLVLNAVNTVAFKAIDAKGKGIYVSGKILNDQGDTISSFSTGFLGMGKLVMMPREGDNYLATIDQAPGMKVRFEPANPNGICLNFKESRESLLFGVSANMKLENKPAFYFVASHKGFVLFYEKIEMNDFAESFKLSKSRFPKGISKISLLDTLLNPLAERLIFVDDGKDDMLKLQLNKREFKPREEVTINIEALLASADSIKSTLSMAVVNRNYLGTSGNSQNIKSYLLLDSDLKGAIESAASCFVNDGHISSAEKLDLLMMVQGWRSYFWDDIEQTETPPIVEWNDAGINIKGVVKKLFWEAPVPEAKVVLGPAGGNFLMIETTSDENGRFEFKQIYLRDSTQVMINAKTKNGGRNTRIILDPAFQKDSVIQVDSINQTTFNIEPHRKFAMDNYYRRMKEMGYNPEKGSILLTGIDVIEQRIPKEATQFRIYQNADKSLKITPNDYQYNNIFDYLDGKVAGLIVTGEQISIRGGGMPLFLIDGIEISDFPPGSGNVLKEIRALRMKEIDKIDILKSGGNLASFGSKGADGVIAIYRTTGDYTLNKEHYVWGRITERINGYQRIGKFYSPKYTIENINLPQPDFRPTLYWNPDVSLLNGKANLGFFTSDETSNYDVFIEGISKSGKICYGTTSFRVNKK